MKGIWVIIALLLCNVAYAIDFKTGGSSGAAPAQGLNANATIDKFITSLSSEATALQLCDNSGANCDNRPRVKVWCAAGTCKVRFYNTSAVEVTDGKEVVANSDYCVFRTGQTCLARARHGSNVLDIVRLTSDPTDTKNEAAGGIFSLANNETICWRNAANSADKCFKVNASDLFEFDSGLTVTGNITATDITASGELRGKCTPTTLASTPYTMLTTDCAIYSSGANREVDLVADPTGRTICFWIDSAHTLTLDPNGTDTIKISGLTPAAGDAIQLAGAVGNNVCLTGLDSSTWLGWLGTGTVTDVN